MENPRRLQALDQVISDLRRKCALLAMGKLRPTTDHFRGLLKELLGVRAIFDDPFREDAARAMAVAFTIDLPAGRSPEQREVDQVLWDQILYGKFAYMGAGFIGLTDQVKAELEAARPPILGVPVGRPWPDPWLQQSFLEKRKVIEYLSNLGEPITLAGLKRRLRLRMPLTSLGGFVNNLSREGLVERLASNYYSGTLIIRPRARYPVPALGHHHESPDR